MNILVFGKVKKIKYLLLKINILCYAAGVVVQKKKYKLPIMLSFILLMATEKNNRKSNKIWRLLRGHKYFLGKNVNDVFASIFITKMKKFIQKSINQMNNKKNECLFLNKSAYFGCAFFSSKLKNKANKFHLLWVFFVALYFWLLFGYFKQVPV